jgi:Domain of unknown function (DUF222)
VERREGQRLADLAHLDARRAAGPDQGMPGRSHRRWLRDRLRMGPGTAAGLVPTARALFHGPLTGTAKALTTGAISPGHAQVLAAGPHDLPTHLAAEADPVLLEAARRLDPPRRRRALAPLRLVADPTAPTTRPTAATSAGGWGRPPRGGHGSRWTGSWSRGRPDPGGRPGTPGPPHDAHAPRSGGQRRADALAELARRSLPAGCPGPVGSAQLLVTVDLDDLLGHPQAPAGEVGGAAGPGGVSAAGR